MGFSRFSAPRSILAVIRNLNKPSGVAPSPKTFFLSSPPLFQRTCLIRRQTKLLPLYKQHRIQARTPFADVVLSARPSASVPIGYARRTVSQERSVDSSGFAPTASTGKYFSRSPIQGKKAIGSMRSKGDPSRNPVFWFALEISFSLQ